ncbi:MAG: ATP-binding cassette domain-containing protein, partial [Dehalococcoidia bacterium]|nr:ATP-binding cassette domain-containing protein [Dehalococcoidia bacterium]
PHQVCQRGIGRTFQIVRPFHSMSVLDNIRVAALSKRDRKASNFTPTEVLELTGLVDRRNQLARELTLASRKRLEVARAIATGPELLLLDEVFAGLNPKEVDEMIGLVLDMRAKGISTTAGVEHVMKVVMSISDRVIVVQYGQKIAEGTPKEIAANDDVIRAYLGVDHA